MSKQKLPVGMDGFEKIRRNGFYYIDKTKLIEQLFLNWGEVNLFTRPRRFGKTLNMSMLKSFFEIGTDPSLFEGLYISGNQAICEQFGFTDTEVKKLRSGRHLKKEIQKVSSST